MLLEAELSCPAKPMTDIATEVADAGARKIEVSTIDGLALRRGTLKEDSRDPSPYLRLRMRDGSV